MLHLPQPGTAIALTRLDAVCCYFIYLYISDQFLVPVCNLISVDVVSREIMLFKRALCINIVTSVVINLDETLGFAIIRCGIPFRVCMALCWYILVVFCGPRCRFGL